MGLEQRKFTLEQLHKNKNDSETLLKLSRKREEMRELIEQETRMMYNRVKKERYLYGNKPGRHLAQALAKKKKKISKLHRQNTNR